MGMFDNLICEHELPDGFDPAGIRFQTKDTPAQWLETYVLREDGRLIDQKSGEDIEPHGAIEFYAGNWCGSYRDLYMTSDDQSPWCAEYTALYDHGELIRIEGGKNPVEGVTHVLRADFDRVAAERRNTGLTAHQIAVRDLRGDWLHWMLGDDDPIKDVELPALPLRLRHLRGRAWPERIDDPAADLRNWSDWLSEQTELPPDAAELLERTRKLLAEESAYA